MNYELLIVFIIILLGFILCCCLGGYGGKEGFVQDQTQTQTLSFTATNGFSASVFVGGNAPSTATVTNSNGQFENYVETKTIEDSSGTTIYYADSNGGIALLIMTGSTDPNDTQFITSDSNGDNSVNYTYVSTSSPKTDTSNSTNTNTDYDNYNHYDKTSYPTIFYGPNGGTARVISTTNSGTLVTTSSNGTTQIYYINKSTNPTSASYYGPNGGSAKIITDVNGKKAVKITMPDGTTMLYNSDNINSQSSQDNSINQYNPSTVTTGSDYNDAFTTAPYYGPNGSQVTGPAGSTYATYDSSAYYNSLPQGIPRNMIPNGQEDLYILKSQVVPPVCPICPEPIIECPNQQDNTKCPPCPPCSRCPEPAFDCAKVPNYNAFNPDTMPVPALAGFSGFGM